MASEREKFSNRKSQWKKSSGVLYRKIEQLLIKVRAGEIVTMGDVYSLAHRINALGGTGVSLARDAAALYMREHVLQEIQTNAHLLELYSKQLYGVLIRRELSTTHYPLFESTLVYDTVVVEDDPDELLDTIMGGSSDQTNRGTDSQAQESGQPEEGIKHEIVDGLGRGRPRRL